LRASDLWLAAVRLDRMRETGARFSVFGVRRSVLVVRYLYLPLNPRFLS